MPSSTYLIPHRGLGAVQALPIHGASVKGTEEFTVTLAPSQEGGLSVETQEQIGTISAADRAEYPEIDLLFRAGLTPAATAQPHADGHVTLLLPRPGLCLPANNPPGGPYTMLGYAPPIDITDLPADLDIPVQARMHVLVNLVDELQQLGAGVRQVLDLPHQILMPLFKRRELFQSQRIDLAQSLKIPFCLLQAFQLNLTVKRFTINRVAVLIDLLPQLGPRV